MASAYTVGEFMTRGPAVIEADKNVMEARSVMKEKRIRHLPVMDGKHLVGLVSDRDIKLALGGMMGNTPDTIMLRDLCSVAPHQVAEETPLAEVAEEMEKMRYGSTLVVKDGQLIGIFTTVDACRALAMLARKAQT